MLSCFLDCQAFKNTLRADSFMVTAPLSCRTKSFGEIMRLLISVSTKRSAIQGRSSSMRSRASEVRPGRPRRGTGCGAGAHCPSVRRLPAQGNVRAACRRINRSGAPRRRPSGRGTRRHRKTTQCRLRCAEETAQSLFDRGLPQHFRHPAINTRPPRSQTGC